MNKSQHSNAVTHFRSEVTKFLGIAREGIAAIQRLVDLGVLTVDPQTGQIAAGAVAEGALAGENDHLSLPVLAAAAGSLLALSAQIDASNGEIRRTLNAIPR